MKKPTRLPAIELLEANFRYDPIEGILWRASGTDVNSWDRTTDSPKIRVGRKSTTVARVCWALFHRKDPIGKIIQHIDGNPFNNRIQNLRAVKL